MPADPISNVQAFQNACGNIKDLPTYEALKAKYMVKILKIEALKNTPIVLPETATFEEKEAARNKHFEAARKMEMDMLYNPDDIDTVAALFTTADFMSDLLSKEELQNKGHSPVGTWGVTALLHMFQVYEERGQVDVAQQMTKRYLKNITPQEGPVIDRDDFYYCTLGSSRMSFVEEYNRLKKEERDTIIKARMKAAGYDDFDID